MTAVQLPTVPGKVDGVVGMDPCVLQCRACGKTATQDRKSVATFVILSGFHFHRCDARKGVRMCPDCLAATVNSCPIGACKR